MPAADVKAVLTAPDAPSRSALIAAHLDRLETELARTRAAVDSLRNLLQPPDTAPAIGHRSVPATPAAARRQAVTAATGAGADPAPRIPPDAAQSVAAADRARRGLALATAELGTLQGEANRLALAGPADPADETLAITEHQRWVLYEDLPNLRTGAQEAQRQRAAVQRAYEEASERLHSQKRLIEQETISHARLVATTLTQLTLRRWLTEAKFDHVIVDEAAAARSRISRLQWDTP
jgi:hypothetical protein